MNELISQKVTAVQLFTEKGLDPVLKQIKAEIDKFTPNIETAKGRKEIISFARKIASSKVFIDKAGKELNADIKAKAKLIDTERKRARDTLDKWRDEVRKPVTEFEEAERIKIEKERLLEIFNMDHEEALEMDDLFNREKALALKEAEIAKVEEEKRQKDEDERLAKEQLERDERLKKEAAEKARRDAEAKIQHEKDEKERIKREAQEAAEIAKRDKIAAEERAKLEKEIAIQKAKDGAKAEAQKKEQQRLAQEKAEKEAAEKKAANKRHQANINNKILDAFNTLEIPKDTAKKIVIAVCQGNIPHMTINY